MFKWLARVYRKAKSCPNYTFGAEGNGCSLGRPLLHCGAARPAHSAFMTRALNTVSHHASVGLPQLLPPRPPPSCCEGRCLAPGGPTPAGSLAARRLLHRLIMTNDFFTFTRQSA